MAFQKANKTLDESCLLGECASQYVKLKEQNVFRYSQKDPGQKPFPVFVLSMQKLLGLQLSTR